MPRAKLLLGNQRSRSFEGQMIPSHLSHSQKAVPPVLAVLPCPLGDQLQGILDLLGNQRPGPPRLLGNQRPITGTRLSQKPTRNKSSQMALHLPNARCLCAIC
jgi:hypothetical protein